MNFKRPEHVKIAEILAEMDSERLLANRCFFGGGTAIVLKFGEFRRSLDIDFLCSDLDGYRELRNALFLQGIGSLFGDGITALREIRADGYGIRTLLSYHDMQIKFEIVREARITLQGVPDPELKVPLLSLEDLFAEKLLANADRCFDRAVAYRDAIDLGHMVEVCGGFPTAGVEKAERAYGADISRKLKDILNFLLDQSHIRHAAVVLSMSETDAISAIASLRKAALVRWPDGGIKINTD